MRIRGESAVAAFRSGVRTMRLFGSSLIGLLLIFAAPARAITTYSGTSVGTNGNVYGWSVTDAYVGGMYHDAYVTATLRSPKGRTASSNREARSTVRADLYLSWDPTDMGWYDEEAEHQYFCWIAMLMFALGETLSRAPLPFVTFSLVNNGPISNDNFGRTLFGIWNGSTDLGTRYYSGIDGWCTGVQIVGQVYPSSFTGSITIHREVRQGDTYSGSTLLLQDAPPVYDDTSVPNLRDDDPQSGGSAGKVYDLDVPGLHGTDIPNDHTYRTRANFREWAVLNSLNLVVSPFDLYWYSRVSVQHNNSGLHFINDVQGDNVAAVGTTRVTWNLQP